MSKSLYDIEEDLETSLVDIEQSKGLLDLANREITVLNPSDEKAQDVYYVASILLPVAIDKIIQGFKRLEKVSEELSKKMKEEVAPPTIQIVTKGGTKRGQS